VKKLQICYLFDDIAFSKVKAVVFFLGNYFVFPTSRPSRYSLLSAFSNQPESNCPPTEVMLSRLLFQQFIYLFIMQLHKKWRS